MFDQDSSEPFFKGLFHIPKVIKSVETNSKEIDHRLMVSIDRQRKVFDQLNTCLENHSTHSNSPTSEAQVFGNSKSANELVIGNRG